MYVTGLKKAPYALMLSFVEQEKNNGAAFQNTFSFAALCPIRLLDMNTKEPCFKF